MKRAIMLLTVSLFLFTAGYCDDKVVKKEELHASAQQFIKKFFPAEKISYVKNERHGVSRGYDVKMVSGKEIEFDKNGLWVEIDCQKGKVPSAVVPAMITKYVLNNYRNSWIMSIDRFSAKAPKYDIKLSNGLSLEFDKNFKVKEIDD